MPEPPSQAPDSEQAADARRGRLKHVVRTLGPLLALALVIGLFGIADLLKNGLHGEFLSARNARTIASPTAIVAVAALGMTVVIIAGGIDLSAGTALAFCATILAWALMQPSLTRFNPGAALFLAVISGAACGALNGVLISSLRVVPFIVTLGTMRLYLGLANSLANETTVRPDKATQVPKWLQRLLSIQADSLYFGFPLGVWIAVGLALITAGLLKYTVFGRRVFALGSNEMAARLCGINVWGMKVAVYTLAGLSFGIAGIYQFSRLSVGQPTSGLGLELKVIAAVVIGGASLNGGRGTILGTLAGAAVMGVIDNGCTLLGLSNPIQDIVLGIVIVAAVTIDQVRQERLSLGSAILALGRLARFVGVR